MNTHEDILSELNWRNATKSFDASKSLSPADLETIKQAILLAPTSYGLQPFDVLIVEGKSIREQLRPVSWGQPQITDASVLMVFCNHDTVNEAAVAAHLDRRAAALGVERSTQANAEAFMNANLAKMTPDYMQNWTARQAYIALGFAMMACARLKVDACPIEGLEVEAYNRILGLEDKEMSAVCVLAIGHRSADDGYTPSAKFRKDMTELIKTT